MFNPISWFQGLFGGNKAQQAYNQVPQAQKDLVAYKAGIGAGIPGQPSTYTTTAPIDNIPAKYAPPPSPATSAAPTASGTATAATPSYTGGFAPGDIQSKIDSINGVYNSIFGNLNRAATDKTNATIKNYGDQNTQLGNDFANNALQTANAFGGRGIADSSYYTNAQNTAKDIYNTNVDKLKTNEQGDLASIAQNLDQTKGTYNSTKDQLASYVPKFGSMTSADLVNLGQSLDQLYRQAVAGNAGIGTTQDFLGRLAAITPYQQTGSAQLKAGLDKLTGANTTQAAKDTIASGMINATPGADQNTWLDYYKSLTRGTA